MTFCFVTMARNISKILKKRCGGCYRVLKDGKVEIFKITKAEAKFHGIASGDFNHEIFIARK